jgi:hypothetical protein
VVRFGQLAHIRVASLGSGGPQLSFAVHGSFHTAAEDAGLLKAVGSIVASGFAGGGVLVAGAWATPARARAGPVESRRVSLRTRTREGARGIATSCRHSHERTHNGRLVYDVSDRRARLARPLA